MKHNHPDRQVWVDSYREENGGLQESDTYEVIPEAEYQQLRRRQATYLFERRSRTRERR